MSLLLAVSFEHGHFVRRLFDKFRYLLRKWNGFLHLDDSMSSSTVRFLCFFLRHFFGDMIFRPDAEPCKGQSSSKVGDGFFTVLEAKFFKKSSKGIR